MTSKRVSTAGMVASVLQIAIFLISLGKIVNSEPDITAVLSLVFFLGMTSAALYGFWRLRRSPELTYFVLIMVIGFLLLIAGIITLMPIGIFLLPGALAILTAGAAYLVAGEGRISKIRWIALFLLSVPFIILIATEIFQIVYLLDIYTYFI